MDTKKLIVNVKSRFDHRQSKLYLEEKYSGQLVLVDQGGLWQVTPALLTFLRTAPETTILLDSNDRPVKITTDTLLTAAETIYDSVMKQWYTEFQELSKQR